MFALFFQHTAIFSGLAGYSSVARGRGAIAPHWPEEKKREKTRF